VLWGLSRGQSVNWAEIAIDCGYCDQPHLNRDFRFFSGITPGAYRPITKDRPHHVAMGE
jgi:AraC-like DNA-binding protein